MSKTTFTGPIRTGKDTGIPTTTTIGYVPVTQQVLFSGGTNGYFVLPPAARMIDMSTVVFVALSGAPGVDVVVETSAGLQYANFSISAKGKYNPDAATVSAPAWLSGAPDGASINVQVRVTAAASAAAVDHLFGCVNVTYMQRF